MSTTSTAIRDVRDPRDRHDAPPARTGRRLLGLGRAVTPSAGRPNPSQQPQPHDDPALTVLLHLR